ncbi:MAG: hypothetical protein OXM03_08500 [Chloroflexota bacterium]|nr:hypothetical protein [Chloroflexota bacterium]MDE2840653.1 hypothetical protein [Chloroflexota bacterium]MDE2931991.1 hypothetical protein [Chloroflexota bacterium]
MNSIITHYYPIFQTYQGLRDVLMETLGDEDLGYRLTAQNPTLGELCREIGEVEQAYIDSFKTFRLDFSYHNEQPGLESSVALLSAWYAGLDRELRAAIESLSEDDIRNRQIDRGHFSLPPQIHLDVYKEALLIFYGKVSIYLRAMGKTLPQCWEDFIG